MKKNRTQTLQGMLQRWPMKVNIRLAQVFTHPNTPKEGLSLEVGLTKAGHVAPVA
jgi:hypothetical protein